MEHEAMTDERLLRDKKQYFQTITFQCPNCSATWREHMRTLNDVPHPTLCKHCAYCKWALQLDYEQNNKRISAFAASSDNTSTIKTNMRKIFD